MFGVKHIEYLTFNDKLYQVYRKIRKESIKSNHILDVRDAWRCDTVLKKKINDEDILFFLVECSDAVIVENGPDPTPAAIPVSPDSS